MSDGDVPKLGPKKTWTDEDWEEYRSLPWTSRRLTDLVVLAPRMSRWIVPLMMRHEERSRS
jgi:hypothetical protein